MRRLAECITTWLIRHETVSVEDRELYEYAAYSLILSVAPIIIAMIIGFMMGVMLKSVWVISPFMIMRKFSGGFHAKHDWTCMIGSCGVLFLCIYIVANVRFNISFSIAMILSVISLIIFSPVDSENRRLSLSEKKRYKNITSIIAIAFAIIYFVLLLVDFNEYAICIAVGLILTASLQIPCVVLNQKQLKNVFWRKRY